MAGQHPQLATAGLDGSLAPTRIEMRAVDIHDHTLGRTDAHAQVALARPAIEVRTQPAIADPKGLAADVSG